MGRMHATVEVFEEEAGTTFTVPQGPGPHLGVVALRGSGGVSRCREASGLHPRLAATDFGVEPLCVPAQHGERHSPSLAMLPHLSCVS
jgi:hypothetical protein